MQNYFDPTGFQVIIKILSVLVAVYCLYPLVQILKKEEPLDVDDVN